MKRLTITAYYILLLLDLLKKPRKNPKGVLVRPQKNKSLSKTRYWNRSYQPQNINVQKVGTAKACSRQAPTQLPQMAFRGVKRNSHRFQHRTSHSCFLGIMNQQKRQHNQQLAACWKTQVLQPQRNAFLPSHRIEAFGCITSLRSQGPRFAPVEAP